MNQVYLDSAATTFVHPDVATAIYNALHSIPGNPSSLHRLGIEAEQAVESARREVAGLIGADPANLVFTSGGTEANNLGISGSLASRSRGGIITTAIEHPSVRDTVRHHEQLGRETTWLPVDSRGMPDLAVLERALASPVDLVTVMAVNNETGAILPLAEIISMVRTLQPKALVHVDAVQAQGRLDLPVGRLDLDFISVSAHKIHGPKGVGALWVKRRDVLEPLFFGGGQERNTRSGTENVPGIVGYGSAARLARTQQQSWREQVGLLRSKFVHGLSGLPVQLISGDNCVPNIVAVAFVGYRAEILLQALSGRGVFVSAGAACSGKKGNLSHVSQALGLDADTAAGLLRFSFSAFNTEDEVDYVLTVLEQILGELSFARARRTRNG